MRFKYSTISPTQNEFDRLPRIPLLLQRGDRSIEAIGLVDSGATVNVLPYELSLFYHSQNSKIVRNYHKCYPESDCERFYC